MVLEHPNEPLRLENIAIPQPGPGQVLIKVEACGVCRTDLHIHDHELPSPKLPLIQGHEIVGKIIAFGSSPKRYKIHDRIGVPWMAHACGKCAFCMTGRENLCDNALFTGYTVDGGFAEYAVADEDYCFPIPDMYTSAAASPLLCAGLIGYRSYRMIPAEAKRIGIYGFGAAAHIVTQIAVSQAKEIYAFTSPGDSKAQMFAKEMGAIWAAGSDVSPPVALDASIIFAPVGSLVPKALSVLQKGGTLVCGGIHMSDIPSFPYDLLWEERSIKSVANLERRDGDELMEIAPKIPIAIRMIEFPLEKANEALEAVRHGKIEGAAVLKMD
jgi:alcohol dehydrogenase, propanol-preferring